MGLFDKMKKKAQEAAQGIANQVPGQQQAQQQQAQQHHEHQQQQHQQMPQQHMQPPPDDDDDDDDDEGYSVVNSDWYEKHMRAGNVNHFGRLNPDDLDGFWFAYFELEQAEQDERLPPKFAEFGITGGKDEWGAIWASFMARHFSHLGHEESQQVFLQSMMNARQKQMMNMQANAAAADPGLTEPVEGITVEGWAQAAATLGRMTDPAQAEQALVQLGMDRAKYERVNVEFQARMQRDTMGVIATIYGQAFTAAQGQQGGFGRGTVDGSAQQQGEAPCSFEKFCEIMGAQSAWSTDGKDVNAMLQEVFGITAMDYSAYSGYWSTKMMADTQLMMKQADLMQQYEAKYRGASHDGDISF